MMRSHTVQQDYRVDHLNGKDGVVWVEGDVVTLDDDDAAWVNRDRDGTLEPVAEDGGDVGESATAEDSQTSAAADEPAEEPATTPAAEQAGGKPPRGSGRRRDSAG